MGGERIIATVNGEPLTLAEFQERFNRAGYTSEGGAGREVKRDFLNGLIERKMMLAEARRKGIELDGSEVEKRVEELRSGRGPGEGDALPGSGTDSETWRSDVREDLLIERLLSREVFRRSDVPPSEVKSYYEKNPQEFHRPDQVLARQIVVASEDEARQILELLRRKGDFAALAREKSQAPEAERGGDLGWFARGEMPPEFNAVFSLPKGGLSGIVKSPYGFHIFKLEETRKAGRVSFAEASQEIAEKLIQEKKNQRYALWLEDLRARTQFEVDYEALEQ